MKKITLPRFCQRTRSFLRILLLGLGLMTLAAPAAQAYLEHQTFPVGSLLVFEDGLRGWDSYPHVVQTKVVDDALYFLDQDKEVAHFAFDPQDAMPKDVSFDWSEDENGVPSCWAELTDWEGIRWSYKELDTHFCGPLEATSNGG